MCFQAEVSNNIGSCERDANDDNDDDDVDDEGGGGAAADGDDDEEEEEEAADMEEFEESGLLDEQDKVICVIYCDVVSI